MKEPQANSQGICTSPADLAVLEGLDQYRRRDGGHRMETWEQARARIEQLAEPARTQRLAELEALERTLSYTT